MANRSASAYGFSVNAGNTNTACYQLGAFLNEVNAQSGKKLTVSQADQLIAAATQIRAVLACLSTTFA